MRFSKDFELLFALTIGEMIEAGRRWSLVARDLDALLLRRASRTSTPGEQRLDTFIEIYGAPLRRQGGRPSRADRLRFRETMKHLRAKYPEFLPIAERRMATHASHEREP